MLHGSVRVGDDGVAEIFGLRGPTEKTAVAGSVGDYCPRGAIVSTVQPFSQEMFDSFRP